MTFAVISGGQANYGDLSMLADSFETHITAEGLSPKTRHSYLRSVAEFVEWCAAGNAPVYGADLKRKHLAAYFAEMADRPSARGGKLSTSTIATSFRHLQQWFRWMVDEEEVDASPLAHLKPPKPQRKSIPVIKADDLQALFATCDKSFEGRRDEAIMRVMLDGGPRLAEVAGMMVDGVSLKYHTIAVVRKGNKLGEISIGVKTAKALDRYLRSRSRHRDADAPQLWLGHKGPLQSQGVARMVERRSKTAGIPHVNPHRFRHTFAHLLRKNGAQTHEVMKLGGWDSEQMVRRYAESAIEEEARATHRRISPGDLF